MVAQPASLASTSNSISSTIARSDADGGSSHQYTIRQ
jgi:hypothetical protein